MPDIPDDFEWVPDAGENQKSKADDNWIAVRKKLDAGSIKRIRAKLAKLQDSLFTRDLDKIECAIQVAWRQNNEKEGPCSEAIQGAQEYHDKLLKFYGEERRKKEAKIASSE